MIKILLVGCLGRMGAAVKAACEGTAFTVAAGVDKNAAADGYADIFAVREKCDVIIDFSNHEYTKTVLAYAKDNGLPLIECVTGHTPQELELIEEYAKTTPIFRSGNMSLGVNVITRLCREAAQLLGADYDIEIIETHHRNKLDAPSGTALMIAQEIESVLPGESELTYDRTGRREKRPAGEIGISSIRGGTITGEHEILFCGNGETITIKHTALSRDLFASGALKAAEFMLGKPAGLYSMKELIAQTAVREQVES